MLEGGRGPFLSILSIPIKCLSVFPPSVAQFFFKLIEIFVVGSLQEELSNGSKHVQIRSLEREKSAPKVGVLEKFSPPAVAKTATVKGQSVLGFWVYQVEIFRVGALSS